VLRGVLRSHINPSGGLNVSTSSTASTVGSGNKNGGAWYFVNAGDNLRFYYKFIEGQSFVLFNKRSRTEAEEQVKKDEDAEEGRFTSSRVVGYELIVLMTDDCEPRDFNSPDRGPINVISRYFGMLCFSFKYVVIMIGFKNCCCVGVELTVQDEDEGADERRKIPASRLVDRSKRGRKK